jgi:uncharacterized protein YjiK
MNVRNTAIWFFMTLCILSCELELSNFNAQYVPYTSAFEEVTGYNLLEPSESYILPETLTEISGLALLNDSTLACVEDESGVIFIFSLARGKMVDQLRFSSPGDFEGIALTGDQAYILRSNGRLYQYSFKDQSSNIIQTPLRRANNTEGLEYDAVNRQLLIACKGVAGLNNRKTKGKAIYSYNLSTGFDPNPKFVITQDHMIQWNVKQPAKLRISKKRMGFMPSGISVNPLNGDIYIIASVGKVLLVLSPAGEIKHYVPLSPRIFRQPEGVCFTSTGDLIISNEGQDGSAKIHVFELAN